MPRNARKDNYSQFLHVMVQGINKEYIFAEEIEIKVYLKYLKENLENRKLEIIAYCIMNNHAHFLIYTQDIMEISKLMSKLNTKYAIYYNKKHNRCGYVFRNRYKSEEILTYEHLMSCINYIHNNPVKAKMCKNKKDYKFSSYNEYKGKNIIINIKSIKKIFDSYGIFIDDIFSHEYELYQFMEYNQSYDRESKKQEIFNDFCKKNNIIDIKELIDNKQKLKKLSTIMYIEYNYTQKEIAELLGINRLRVHRILHEL
ncbi:MAG: transposase [Clostridia bacterium]|nr:transposase [Clostridia bacterium]